MSKLPNINASIFSTMSAMANEFSAINLAQGFPNFPEDPRLLEIVAQKSKESVHQYAPMAGLPVLQSKIGNIIQKYYSREINIENEILITAGATQAIYTTINALVNHGDEVVVLDPSYDSYEPSVLMAGAKPVRVNLSQDFSPDFNKIEDAITSKTKMIVINNPHNPSGKIWNVDDFIALENILEKHPAVLVLADEVYEFITFKHLHISFHQREKLINRTIVISSFGKSLHVTGWKIGYAIAPKHLMDEIKKVHQFTVFSVNSLTQNVIAEYLDFVDFVEVRKMYLEKRDIVHHLLKGSKFELLPCEGTYFQLIKYNGITNENDLEFAKRLVKENGVATIPVSVFYQDNLDQKVLRLCFAKADETIEKGIERLINVE